MSETKTIIIPVSVEVDSDGEHCGPCDLRWRPGTRQAYCSGHGEEPLEEDERGSLRCEQCLAAAPQPEPCAQCGGACRCEEDRR